jgi:hypothetical protein
VKRSILVSAAVGFALVLFACPWADAQSVSQDPIATSITVSPQTAAPAPVNPSVPEPFMGSARNNDARAIGEAIDKFKLLFESEDADILRSNIWPSMSAKQYRAIKEMFEAVSEVTLRETCPGSPTIVGDSAEWNCNEMLAYYVRGKSRPWQIHTIQFRLKKLNGTWYVDGRSGK